MNSNRLTFLALFCLTMFCMPAYSQDYSNESDGLYGYTSINFDPSTNIVTAYSETDADSQMISYYQVNVSMSLRDSNGHLLANPSNSGTGSYISVTASAQGSPSTTYTAIGLHYVMQSQQQYGCYTGQGGYQCGFYFLDYFDEEMFSNDGISEPGLFDFTSNGQSIPDNSPDIVLGETYDSATLTTPPPCGDVRDQIIGEYRTNNTPFKPVCADFTTSSPDSNWTFAQLNSGNFPWAIIGTYFTTGLDSVKTDVGSLTITSAYRDPFAEQAAAQQNNAHYPPGSRHQYGDAADLPTNSNQTTFTNIRSSGIRHGGCGEPQANSTLTHVHLDWRQQAPPKWKTTCASSWTQ
jgi:hypothetical protein